MFLSISATFELPKLINKNRLQERGQKRVRTSSHQRPGETAAPKNV